MVRFGLQHSSDDVVLYKTISSEMHGLEFQRAQSGVVLTQFVLAVLRRIRKLNADESGREVRG